MSENSIKSIGNGVIASVIAGIFLLAVPVLRRYFFSLLSWLWSGVIWCWEALFESYAIPGWAWAVISVFAFVGLIHVCLFIKGESKQPEFKSYVQDMIHGAKWRWCWDSNQISNLWCFCPRCDATLVYDDSSCKSPLSNLKKTNFICENCGNSIITSINGGNVNYATNAVMREIDRRIRTGEYKHDSEGASVLNALKTSTRHQKSISKS